MTDTNSSDEEATFKRLEYFAQIGDFLELVSQDNAQEDEFYKARTALINFTNEINKINLSLKTKKGINSFIKYIDIKISKRMKQSNGAFFQK